MLINQYINPAHLLKQEKVDVSRFVDNVNSKLNDLMLVEQELQTMEEKNLHLNKIIQEEMDRMDMLDVEVFHEKPEQELQKENTQKPVIQKPETGTKALVYEAKVNNEVETECPICYSVMCDPVKLECKHVFCRVCLKHLLKNESMVLMTAETQNSDDDDYFMSYVHAHVNDLR